MENNISNDSEKTRVAVSAVIVENPDSVETLNKLLHEYSKYIIGRMGIPYKETTDCEADDWMARFARQYGDGREVVIVSQDSDLFQLIDRNVKILRYRGDKTVLCDENYIIEKLGIVPGRYAAFKALTGDSSDNIPGVKGIGEKTAKNLLQQFGSLDGVYEHLDDKAIKPKQRENLVTYKDDAYLSYELATIRPEAPIEFDPLDAVVRHSNNQELYNLFVRLEFVKLIDKYHLRGADVEAAPVKVTSEPLKRCDCLPAPGTDCALYLAPDGSLGVAWESGVCAVTPLEAMCLGSLLEQGAFPVTLTWPNKKEGVSVL